MAGFMRKKATLSRRTSIRLGDPKQNFITPSERPSSDVPPSLPPLLLSTPSFADPDLDSSSTLPPAASPPVLPLATELSLDDLWDPWKAYADTPPSAPRLDSQTHANVTRPSIQTTRPTGPSVRSYHY